MTFMSSRMARLAARLDELSASPGPGPAADPAGRCGNELRIRLPALIAGTLGLRDGDELLVRIQDSGTLSIAICRPDQPAPPASAAGYQGSSSSTVSSSCSSRISA